MPPTPPATKPSPQSPPQTASPDIDAATLLVGLSAIAMHAVLSTKLLLQPEEVADRAVVHAKALVERIRQEGASPW